MNNNILPSSAVVSVNKTHITFDNGMTLFSDHVQDCCEQHFLDFEHLTLEDFAGLAFDLSGNDFFERVEGYGIRLRPLNGHPVSIPGYGFNNGYYSQNLTLVLQDRHGARRVYKIDECQEWKLT